MDAQNPSISDTSSLFFTENGSADSTKTINGSTFFHPGYGGSTSREPSLEEESE